MEAIIFMGIQASGKFSLLLKDLGTFDCRIVQLPRREDVIDYFRWRQGDAHRNSLNAHCYWMLRGEGMGATEATKKLSGRSISWKNELLFQHGLNFNNLPLWERRGIGIYRKEVEKIGWNPAQGVKTLTTRRELYVDLKLPMGEEYDQLLYSFLE